MSLTYEIKDILRNEPEGVSAYENSDLIRRYQKLLDEGVITRRGFTLQTIEEKQRDVPEVRITYSVSFER